MKYKDVEITFLEVPDEVSLCINITNCPFKCEGCHSPYLREDIGEELNEVSLLDLINRHKGITCIVFMGGDSSPEDIENLAAWIKDNTNLKVCWYSGNDNMPTTKWHLFDFIKKGSYQKDKGGLNSPTTNQKFYKVVKKRKGTVDWYMLEDITCKFYGK